MRSDRVESIWLQLKEKGAFLRADFLLQAEELAKNLNITQEAAAYIIAKEQGVDITSFLEPAKRGRILDVGPVKLSRAGGEEIPYCLFTLVNDEERILGCAFGDKVSEIRELEDRAVEVARYTMSRSTRQRMLRATERSEVKVLSEDAVPPVWELKKARVGSLREMSGSNWTWVVEAVVVDDEVTEYNACPICGRAVELRDEGWVCGVHGLVEVQVRRVLHLHVADSSGVYPAVCFGAPSREGLFKRRILVKGYFREGELQISKFYEPRLA
jgi:hypothetical protein